MKTYSSALSCNFWQVHAFDGAAPWEDLKARLSPETRRVFGFFHPSMPEEPLVVLHTALMPSITTSMRDILGKEGDCAAQSVLTCCCPCRQIPLFLTVELEE